MKDRSSRRPPQKAFTLVEWVVVVVILGILASLVSFYFFKVKTRSEDSEALINLAAIRKGELLVQAKNGSFVNASDTAQIKPPRLND